MTLPPHQLGRSWEEIPPQPPRFPPHTAPVPRLSAAMSAPRNPADVRSLLGSLRRLRVRP